MDYADYISKAAIKNDIETFFDDLFNKNIIKERRTVQVDFNDGFKIDIKIKKGVNE